VCDIIAVMIFSCVAVYMCDETSNGRMKKVGEMMGRREIYIRKENEESLRERIRSKRSLINYELESIFQNFSQRAYSVNELSWAEGRLSQLYGKLIRLNLDLEELANEKEPHKDKALVQYLIQRTHHMNGDSSKLIIEQLYNQIDGIIDEKTRIKQGGGNGKA